MGGIVNYDRDKDPKINDTPIDIDFLAGEEPTGAAALTGDNSGSTGILNIVVTADADESGGTDVQNLFRIDDISHAWQLKPFVFLVLAILDKSRH